MGRKTALVLTPRLPWPPDDGGRVVARQNLIAMARDYDTTLLSFVPVGSEAVLPEEAARLGVRLVAVPFRPTRPAIAAVRGLFGRWPYTLARYRSRAFDAAVRRESTALRPAIVVVHHLHLATYAEAVAPTPWVLREHNLEFLWMARYARAAGPSLRGAYAALQSVRLRRTEEALCSRAALVLTIQDEETRALRALVPGARVETLPVGVDTGAFVSQAARAASTARPAGAAPVVLLAGSFEWPPNAEGALRFLRDGWPRLRALVPSAVLRVAGKAPPPALREACRSAGAALAADVPSMGEEYARAALLLVPLWVGAGARVKIVEALGRGLPVVATPLAAEGLDLERGTHYAAGETAEALAEAAASLLGSHARRAAMAEAGHAVAASRWSLEAVAALQSRLLASVAAAAPRGGGS